MSAHSSNSSSQTSPREYELVSSRPMRRIDSEMEEDPSGWYTHSVRNRLQVRRRRKSIFMLACALVAILVLITKGVRRNRNSAGSTAATEVTSNVTSTQPPTPVSTPPPTVSPTQSENKPSYKCEGDRLQHGKKLKTGHFICDHHKRYRFGMDETGALRYADDGDNTTTVLFQGHKGFYFELSVNGLFGVYNKDGDTKWKRECSDNPSFYEKCLPKFDCPYLHLHSGGTIVLNWIDDEGDWHERNILHMYDFNY